MDPYEKFEHVTNQIYGDDANPMGGFLSDYATIYDNPTQILESYTPDELPVLNGLARNFAVCDRYFSSVPTQTNCNRAFAATGNSLGMTDDEPSALKAWVNNRDMGFIEAGPPRGNQFNQRTMWNVLSDNGLDSPDDWMQYHSLGSWLVDHLGVEGYAYTRALCEQLQDKRYDANFDTMDVFLDRAKAGTLPRFSFLEAEWGLKRWKLGINGNDYHPPSNLAPGEEFLNEIYSALKSNEEAMRQTLFIINFDEHGGTYDHVTPPSACKPWGDGTPEPEKCECNFSFDRFGVRVPLILVSPYIKEGTVFRAAGDVPYDHTSLIATILHLMGIDQSKWKLGNRVRNAPYLELDLILSRKSPRTKLPEITSNSAAKVDDSIPPYNDIQHTLIHKLLDNAMKTRNPAAEDVQNAYKKHFAAAKTAPDLMDALHGTLKDLA